MLNFSMAVCVCWLVRAPQNHPPEDCKKRFSVWPSKLGPISNYAMGPLPGTKKGLVNGALKLLASCFATEERKPLVYVFVLSVVVGEPARPTLPGVLRNRFK